MKLEPFAWSHWIRKYLFYLRYKFRPRSRPALKMAQLAQTFPRKNWKTSFLNEDQKVELVIRLFSDECRPSQEHIVLKYNIYWSSILHWMKMDEIGWNWMKNKEVQILKFLTPEIFWKLQQSWTIEARTFCLVSLDPEVSILPKV